MITHCINSRSEPSLSVAVIDPVGGHGGMHYYDFELCRGLLAAGCRVSLYTCDETKDPYIPGLRLYTVYRNIYSQGNLWLRGLRFVRGTLAALRQAVANGEVVCHYHSFSHSSTDFILLVIAKLHQRKVVITVHDADSLASSGARRSRITGVIYRFADRIIAHNRASAQEVERSGLRSSKIAVIAHGHYLESVHKVPSPSSARSALGIAQSDKVILFFGQIKDSKGLDILLEAMSQVVGEVQEAILLIAGRPWKTDFSQYGAAITRLNLQTHCRLHIGFIPDEEVSVYYAAADVVVLPYRRIYQSGVLLMAMSYSKPVIISNLPAMCESVTDNVNGWLFQQGSKDDLAKVLIRVLRDAYRRKQVAASALEYIRKHHDWTQLGAETSAVYRDVVSNHND